MRQSDTISRRAFLASLGAAGAATALGPLRAAVPPESPAAHPGPILTRAIPSSGERLPLIGLGSWITFNVGDDVPARNA